MCTSRPPKNARTIHFMLGGRFGVCPEKRLGRWLVHHTGGFFSSNKSAPATRKKDFHINRPSQEFSIVGYVFIVSGLKL
jgi:hypothetical protein